MNGTSMADFDHPRFTVFLVDPSVVARARVISLLGDFAHVTVIGEAASREEARAAIEDLRPDLVIADPGRSAEDAIELVRSFLAPDPSPTIVIFTHFAYPSLRDECLREGAEYFFDKARDMERFRHVVTALAERHLARRARERSEC